MKTFDEFLEKYQNDESFFDQFSDLVKQEKAAGASNLYEGAAKAAQKLDYDVSEDQIRNAIKARKEISEDDLGKVSGGVVCACGYKDKKDQNRGCNW